MKVINKLKLEGNSLGTVLVPILISLFLILPDFSAFPGLSDQMYLLYLMALHFRCGIVFVYRGWERALQWEPEIAQPPRGP